MINSKRLPSSSSLRKINTPYSRLVLLYVAWTLLVTAVSLRISNAQASVDTGTASSSTYYVYEWTEVADKTYRLVDTDAQIVCYQLAGSQAMSCLPVQPNTFIPGDHSDRKEEARP